MCFFSISFFAPKHETSRLIRSVLGKYDFVFADFWRAQRDICANIVRTHGVQNGQNGVVLFIQRVQIKFSADFKGGLQGVGNAMVVCIGYSFRMIFIHRKKEWNMIRTSWLVGGLAFSSDLSA
jgi:hypothetical protein